MTEPGRQFGTDNRYGFNGKERDKDINSLTAYDYGFRIYNPALGKFLSVDPLSKEYPWNSTYAFAEGDPINCIDLDGLEKIYHYQVTPNKGKLQLSLINEEGDDFLAGSSYTLTYNGKTLSSDQYDKFSLFGQFQVSTAFSNIKDDWLGKYEFKKSTTIEQFNLAVFSENEKFQATCSALSETGRDKTMENFQNFSLAAWGMYGALYSSINTYSNGRVSTVSSTNNANPQAAKANAATGKPNSPIQSISTKITTPQSGSRTGFDLTNGTLTSRGTGIKGTYDFVVTTEGKLMLGKGHYNLSGGASKVQAAGQIKIWAGKVISINNLSGHYLPSATETKNFGTIFKNLGIKVSGARLQIYNSGSKIPETTRL